MLISLFVRKDTQNFRNLQGLREKVSLFLASIGKKRALFRKNWQMSQQGQDTL